MANFTEYCVKILGKPHGCPAILPCLKQNSHSQNRRAPYSEDFSIAFGKGGRSRIVILQGHI